jgi:hypothetical protein
MVAHIAAAQLWMCMPIMRFIVVHGLADDASDDSGCAPAAPSARQNKTLIHIVISSHCTHRLEGYTFTEASNTNASR